MARTSRRNKPRVSDIGLSLAESRGRIRTAAYARLSVEKFEGDTIATQIEQLKEYIKASSDLALTEVFVDNGYTGTNFERPEFIRMMEEVQAGRIQCIVVKDLSRFGRNFIETGYYIETLLPKLGARLIAINDDFDSSRETDVESLLLPVRNMINELYAKDFSKKVSLINEAKRRNGTYKIELPPYGYSIDKEANKLVVNNDTAPVVQLVFRTFLNGSSTTEIANRLNLLGIRTPLEYKCDNEYNRPMTADPRWDAEKVRKIIKREEYMGDRCLGRKRKAMYKKVNDWKVPKDQWTIYRDDHEPLVTRQDWERAQSLIAGSKDAPVHERIDPESDIYDLFRGKVYCKACSRQMYFQSVKGVNGNISSEASVYICKSTGQSEGRCGCRNTIKFDALKIAATEEIRTMVRIALDKAALHENIMKKQNEDNPVFLYKSQISRLKLRLAENSDQSAKLYEDFSYGIVDTDDYLKLKSRYREERKLIEQKMDDVTANLRHAEEQFDASAGLAEKLQKYMDDFEIDTKLVDLLIDKIYVHEDRSLEFNFRFRDMFEETAGIGEGGDTA